MSTRQSVIAAIQELRDLVDNGAALASKANGECAEQAIETIAQYVQSTFVERLEHIEKEIREWRQSFAGGVRQGGIRPDGSAVEIEILTPAEQEAKCWEKIEALHAQHMRAGDAGFFEVVHCLSQGRHGHAAEFWRSTLEHGAIVRVCAHSGHGATRLDALAQLAQWCEQQLTSGNG